MSFCHHPDLSDDLLSFFDATIFSDEVGRSKPHPAPFHAALAELQASPREAVHIGDLLHTDVVGARGVGMVAVRYAGVYDDRDVAHPDADRVIRTCTELPAVLDGLDAG